MMLLGTMISPPCITWMVLKCTSLQIISLKNSDFTEFENKFYSINHREDVYLPLILKGRIHILISVLKDYKCQHETKLDESI